MYVISRAKQRAARIGELLREKIASTLLYKCRDPRLRHLTITEVEVSDDLRRAWVYYHPRHEADLPQIQTALEHARGFIKQEIASEQILRVMPELLFCYDESLQRGARIESLLRRVRQESSETGGSSGS